MEENDRVEVELNLSDDVLYGLMLMAHKQDITLNQLVNDIIREELGKEKPFDCLMSSY